MFHNDLTQANFLVIFIYCIKLSYFFVLFSENASANRILDLYIMYFSLILPFVVCRLFGSRSDKVAAEKFFDPTVSVDTFGSEAFISVFAYEDFVRHGVKQVEQLLLL